MNTDIAEGLRYAAQLAADESRRVQGYGYDRDRRAQAEALRDFAALLDEKASEAGHSDPAVPSPSVVDRVAAELAAIHFGRLHDGPPAEYLPRVFERFLSEAGQEQYRADARRVLTAMSGQEASHV